MLRGTDLKVGQRIRLRIRGKNKIHEYTGTIVPRKANLISFSPMFEADNEAIGLHNGECNYWCQRYWFMNSHFKEGFDFDILQETPVGVSELI